MGELWCVSYTVICAGTVENSVVVHQALVPALVELRPTVSSVDQIDHVSAEGCTERCDSRTVDERQCVACMIGCRDDVVIWRTRPVL
jgi:hypothetical protein